MATRILIAEDDKAVREFIGRALRLAGHEVASVNDGLAALEALRAKPYDLLISDIMMPGLDGISPGPQGIEGMARHGNYADDGLLP